MTSPDAGVEIADVFVFLADSLRNDYDVVDTMDVLVQASTRFTSAVAAGVLLADRSGVLHVVASTSERTSDVEEAQLGFDEGPCLQSFNTGEPVDTPDFTHDSHRWPRFAAVAAARGFRAGHASPLRLRERTLGAMNLFSPRPGLFSERDTALGLALAQVATISLLQRETVDRQATVNDQLQRALDSRIVIEQAKGILSQRHNVPIDMAFTLLRNRARSSGSRLYDIAHSIVNHGLGA